MAKKVDVKGYVAGGVEFTKDDIAMAKAWYNEHNPETPITRRVPDQVLVDWFDADCPEYDIQPTKTNTNPFPFAQGERRRFNAWLASEGKENSQETKAEWWALDKPVPAGYVDKDPTKRLEDVLATIFGFELDDNGAITDKPVEVQVTREMVQAYRGAVRGAASTADIVKAAEHVGALNGIATNSVKRGETVFHYNDGEWTSSLYSKRELATKLNETEQESMRLAAENKRLLELLDKLDKGMESENVKKAPTGPRTRTRKAKAEAEDTLI